MLVSTEYIACVFAVILHGFCAYASSSASVKSGSPPLLAILLFALVGGIPDNVLRGTESLNARWWQNECSETCHKDNRRGEGETNNVVSLTEHIEAILHDILVVANTVVSYHPKTKLGDELNFPHESWSRCHPKSALPGAG